MDESMQSRSSALAPLAYVPLLFIVTVLMKGRDSYHMFHAKNGAAMTILFLIPVFTPIIFNGVVAFWLGNILFLSWAALTFIAAIQSWRGEKWIIPGVTIWAQNLPLESLAKNVPAPTAKSEEVPEETSAETQTSETSAQPTAEMNMEPEVRAESAQETSTQTASPMQQEAPTPATESEATGPEPTKSENPMETAPMTEEQEVIQSETTQPEAAPVQIQPTVEASAPTQEPGVQASVQTQPNVSTQAEAPVQTGTPAEIPTTPAAMPTTQEAKHAEAPSVEPTPTNPNQDAGIQIKPAPLENTDSNQNPNSQQ